MASSNKSNGGGMFAAERRSRIYEHALRSGSVSVTELAEMLGVVENTVRRDLDVLHEEGKLTRSHGGAVLRERGRPVPHYSQTRDTHIEEKSWIGQAALRYVPSSGLIFVNSGSTTYQLALRLPGVGGPESSRQDSQSSRHRGLQLMTTSLEIASFVAARGEIDVHVLGGKINPDSLNSTCSMADRVLDELYWDVAFLGVEAADLAHGVTSSYLDAAHETKIIEHSRKTVVLCDSSKIGRVSNVLIAPLKAVDVLITDRGIDPATAAALEQAGVNLEIAGPTGDDDDGRG